MKKQNHNDKRNYLVNSPHGTRYCPGGLIDEAGESKYPPLNEGGNLKD